MYYTDKTPKENFTQCLLDRAPEQLTHIDLELINIYRAIKACNKYITVDYLASITDYNHLFALMQETDREFYSRQLRIAESNETILNKSLLILN